MFENYTTFVKVLLYSMRYNTTQHNSGCTNSYLDFSFMPISNESLKMHMRYVECRQCKHIHKSCVNYCLCTSTITNRSYIQNFRVMSDKPRINEIISCPQTTITLIILMLLKLLFTFLLRIIIIIIIIIIITGTVFTILIRKKKKKPDSAGIRSLDHLHTRKVC